MLRAKVNVFVHDYVVLVALAMTGVLHLATWAIILTKSGYAGSILILHYNIEFGVDYVGQWGALFALPLVGFLFFALDAVVAFLNYQKIKLLSYIMMYTSVVVHIILVTTALLIRFLNS